MDMYSSINGYRCVSPARHLSVGRWLAAAALIILFISLAACSRDSTPVEVPPPSDDTGDASGHYCGMLLAEHSGPKGQIHLASRQDPVWFSSVHDTIVFTRLPEEPRDITAIYVHDMGQTDNWDNPANVWVDARDAVFVIDSDRLGGMGTPEAVPFSDPDAADAFIEKHGGRVLTLDDIPDEYFSGLVDGHGPVHEMHDGHDHHDGLDHHSGSHDDHDEHVSHEE